MKAICVAYYLQSRNYLQTSDRRENYYVDFISVNSVSLLGLFKLRLEAKTRKNYKLKKC